MRTSKAQVWLWGLRVRLHHLVYYLWRSYRNKESATKRGFQQFRKYLAREGLEVDHMRGPSICSEASLQLQDMHVNRGR